MLNLGRIGVFLFQGGLGCLSHADVVIVWHIFLENTTYVCCRFINCHLNKCPMKLMSNKIPFPFLALDLNGNYPGLDVGFPCGSAGQEFACNVGDLGSIPGLGRSPGERKGYPLQYSGLENSMDRILHGVSKSQTRLSDFDFHFQTLYLESLSDFFFFFCSPTWHEGSQFHMPCSESSDS